MSESDIFVQTIFRSAYKDSASVSRTVLFDLPVLVTTRYSLGLEEVGGSVLWYLVVVSFAEGAINPTSRPSLHSYYKLQWTTALCSLKETRCGASMNTRNIGPLT